MSAEDPVSVLIECKPQRYRRDQISTYTIRRIAQTHYGQFTHYAARCYARWLNVCCFTSAAHKRAALQRIRELHL